MPTGWAQWKMWQFSSTGSVSGIAGSVDVNKWNGTFAQLITYVDPPPVPDAGTIKPDAGIADAGTRPDAGTKPDAGVQPDAGTDAGRPTVDAGLEEDAGTAVLDGGQPPATTDGGEGEVLGSGRTAFIQSCTGKTP